MKNIITGRAFVYGNNIDTDQIYPGRYLESVDPQDIKNHCLEGVDEKFAEEVREGDIVVAGTNFGCGSSREHAAISLKASGVSVILAESFARIFYRNATNLALPLMICKDISKKVKTRDILEVHVREGYVINKTSDVKINGGKIPDYIFNIIENGGIKKLFQDMR
ncbi:3-isopropylmalate dehydratase small subunit [Schnuerera sp. xch1]|uniref:LeuD/DmdB family oxidoreductase small subunit n=1 Tax=Schnuerera sp. xch1 TaxID=2874283 RepID=UPI001CBC8888|nr:3-isopropylmalate dehydratase small subunit [Schnuerera sp. xch1]MBZ2174025.1 3-isopropylmalate dehydratase small subunit [Schnuerera sp. xch1]